MSGLKPLRHSWCTREKSTQYINIPSPPSMSFAITLAMYPDILCSCVITASLDRSVQVWDLRKLARSKRVSTKLLEPVVTMPHARSVNCAYFSPSGSHCVTVCQNNFNYIYETSASKWNKIADKSPAPLLTIPHNNQTGRWITKLHPSWVRALPLVPKCTSDISIIDVESQIHDTQRRTVHHRMYAAATSSPNFQRSAKCADPRANK